MSKTYYSTFNPHEIDEETLERLFVARGDLAADVMEGLRESATTGNKHQRLLIGPRGIGKTHFVTLTYRRVRRDPELDGRLRIAWLNEDLRTHNYAGLLHAILKKLGEEYDDESVVQTIEDVLDLADFDLQVWFSEPELGRLATGSAGMEQDAARRAMLEQDPLLPTLAADFASHQNAGNHELALAAAESAIERLPGVKVHWLRKARSLEALNRPARERLPVWEKLAELDPEDADAWYEQSFLLYNLGRFEQAVETSRKAVELSPESATFVRGHSLCLSRAGRRDEARLAREKALELRGEPANAADWAWRANDLSELQRMDEAWVAFRRSLEEDPYQVATWGSLWQRLSEEGRYKLVHDMAAYLAQLLPDQARLYSYLGTAQMHLGCFEEARALYERALALDPDLDSKGEPTAYYLALALNRLGRNEEALTAVEAYETDSERMRFRLALSHASIQLELKRHEQGEAELNELLFKYRPPLWTDRDLTAVAASLLASSDAVVWRPTIEVWLACCARHQCLNELGQGFVRGLEYLAIPRISDEAARAWHETWRELAADVEELELPLKLYRAGVDLRAGAGRRALLGLTQEERGLLEPWLSNLFAEEPDELDREMRELLRGVVTSDEARSEYTRFICTLLRGEEGRYRIVDALEDVPLADPSVLPEGLEVEPWTMMPTSPQEEGVSFTGTVLYANALLGLAQE